jgi:23S rRNA pseudouridine1911/1915/1917 synthase
MRSLRAALPGSLLVSESVVVPEELAGVRVDAGLAQLLDISRSAAALLISEGNVTSGGVAMGKSAKLVAGALIDVTVPERPDPLEVVEEVVEGLKILLDDEEFVVIDKPVGVAAHPSPGWVGPTVVGGLAGAGYRISTSERLSGRESFTGSTSVLPA